MAPAKLSAGAGAGAGPTGCMAGRPHETTCSWGMRAGEDPAMTTERGDPPGADPWPISAAQDVPDPWNLNPEGVPTTAHSVGLGCCRHRIVPAHRAPCLQERSPGMKSLSGCPIGFSQQAP